MSDTKPISVDALKRIANSNPLETLYPATTALAGKSKCRYCGVTHLFYMTGPLFGGHAKDCIWELAKKSLEDTEEKK